MPAVRVLASVLLALLWTGAAVLHNKEEESREYWYELGRRDIGEALNKPINRGVAKNVVILLGDGLGMAALTAGRIFKGQKQGRSGEEGYLAFDRLPNVALLKTYNVDKQVADSAGTATAYLSGVKANYFTVGLTAAVKKADCAGARKKVNRAHSIMMWAQEHGKETGIVTNTRITHATPSAAYGATPQRQWECDSRIIKEDDSAALLCKDLARQLVEDEPGRNLKVILAGGRQPLGAQFPNSTSSACNRTDGRNLVLEWQHARQSQGDSYAYVTNTGQLDQVDVDNTDYIMGLFSDSHLAYVVNRDPSPLGEPSLSQLAATAIKRLSRSEKGYVLLIEGGRIDHALHHGKAQLALEEVVAFDEAVETALKMVDLKDTLFIVTADHSHGLTINGYPDRGNDILGTTFYKDGVTDRMDYTTLLFTTGPGYKYHWDGQKVMRENVTGIDTHNQDFVFQAAVPTQPGWATHGGEDVAVFAAGPWAHLFHRVHEQSYVAHVIGYAARIGPFYGANGRPPISLHAMASGALSASCVSSILVWLMASMSVRYV